MMSPVPAALRAVLADAGRPASVQGMPFATDASKLARAGTPSVVFGPGSIADAHSAAEPVAHADGHTCYLLDAPEGRALFSGDCVFTGGRISLQNLHDARVPE